MKWVLRLYARAWRRRYGEEFAALLEQVPVSPAVLLDVLRGALDAHTRPQVPASEPGTGDQRDLPRRSLAMTGTPAASGPTRLALVGLVLLFPALLFELVGSSSVWAPGNGVYRWFAGVLRDPSAFRAFNLLSPIVFLGGSLAALVLNMAPIARLGVRRDVGELVGLMRYRGHRANVAVVAMTLLVLALLGLYLVLENWRCVMGQQPTC